MKKFRKALSMMLVICMFFSVLAVNTNAEYSVPTGNIWMSYSGADHYVRYGGTVIDKIRITANATLDGVISSTERYLLTKNTATIDSIVAEDPAGSDYDGNLCTWDLIDPAPFVFIDVLLTNVTADPILTVELKQDNQGSIIDANHKKQNVLTSQTEMADSPVVHLVYDLDVTAGANGKVEYQAAKFMDPNVDDDYTDLIKYWKSTGLTNQQAGKMIFSGNNVLNKTETTSDYTGDNAVTSETTAATTQWSSGEDIIFTVTPDTNYQVDEVTAKIGTKDVTEYLTDNEDGTYTLNVPESEVTAADTKVVINATFKGEDKTITSSVDSTSPANSGTITPLGAQTVEYGTDKAFTIAPEDGYCVDTVVINENGATTTYETTDENIYDEGNETWGYTFENVTQDGSITVKFAVDANGDLIPDGRQVTLTFTAGDNGSFKTDSIPADAKGTDKTKTYTIIRNKTDEEGNTAEDGSYTVVAADVAEPVAAEDYAFDLWKQGDTDLEAVNATAPVDIELTSDTTFTATFATEGHVDPEVPAKYETTFKFTLDANSQFKDSTETVIYSYAIKYDENDVPSLTGTATLTADMIPEAEGKFGFKFANWTSDDFEGEKQTTDLDEMTFENKTEVVIQANAENAAAILKVVEESYVALGKWDSKTDFIYTVQLRIGDLPATAAEIEAITLNDGELFRVNTTDFPGAVSDYLDLNDPVFSDYEEVTVEGVKYGKMTMTISMSAANKFKSSIVTFTATYDDGVEGSEDNSDTFDTIIPGDVDRDGVVNAYDSSLIRQTILKGKESVTEANYKYAELLMDVDGDEIINAYDSSMIRQMLTEKITTN